MDYFTDILLEEVVANGFYVEDLIKMSIFDILAGKSIDLKHELHNTAHKAAQKEIGWPNIIHQIHNGIVENANKKFFDYSHLLPKAQRDNDIKLYVAHAPKDTVSEQFNDHHLHVFLTKENEGKHHIIGFLQGSFYSPHNLSTHFSYITKPFRGQKMGIPMYEAFMAHGVKKLGARIVQGGAHSSAAEAVHRSLASKHGLDYSPVKDRGDSLSYKYFIKSEVELEELEKSWKNALIGLASMLHVGGHNTSAPPRKISLHPQLQSISMLESGGGKYLDHKKSKKGVYDTAFGSVGFKPESAYETFLKHKDLVNSHPELKDKNKFLDKFTNDPNFYNTIANLHWSHLLSRLKEPAKAAYGWRWGEGAAQLATEDTISADPYVSKFKKLSGLTKNELEIISKSILDILPGNKEQDRFNYRHVLPKHLQNDIKLHIKEQDIAPKNREIRPGDFTHSITAILSHGGQEKGHVKAYYRPSDKALDITLSDLDESLHGQGLGRSMYEAVMAHGKHVHGAEKVRGDIHSSMAKRVHESLARRHGLDYKPKLSQELTGLYPDKEAFDNKYAPYEYHIKSEEVLDKGEDLDNKIDEFHLKLKSWLREGNNEESYEDPLIELSLTAPEVTNDINWHEEQVAIRMLGNDFTLHRCLKAACFLGHKDWPSEDKLKEALDLYEDDLTLAALYACDLDRTKENLSLLHTIMELYQAEKLDKHEIFNNIDFNRHIYNVDPVFYEARDAARIIQSAFENKKVYSISLQEGKYSKGSKIARDPNLGMLWLLKPASKKLSPAAGVREESANTAQRETAAYQIACLLGLNNVIPRAYLIRINGRMVAAMPFLPSDFISMNVVRKSEPTKVKESLDNYLRSGELYKWAVFDLIIGNADRHSGNLLFDIDTLSVALIDHGAAFAGEAFNPGNDISSFTPFYLRYNTNKRFKKLDSQEKFNEMPILDSVLDDALSKWINNISELDLVSILDRYGLDGAPVLKRLRMLKSAIKPKWAYINSVWAGLIHI